MAVDFRSSQTMENLMRAFAGESQARNRYLFAASQARKEHHHVIEAIFRFTADQEKEHAEVFYGHLKELAGETIRIYGTYPVDIADDVAKLLRMAQHNEYEEYDPVYKAFGDTAKEEGFNKIAASFHMISKIEKIHGDRFGKFARLMEEKKLYEADEEVAWMCLNCGHVHWGKEAPKECPVCHHDRGYFIRLELAPFHNLKLEEDS